MDKKRLRIFSGNANPVLAQEIAAYLGLTVGDAFVGRFNNGEIQVMIDESVRGTDVFIVQPTNYPVNDNMMELLIMIDAVKRASARNITAVIPYYAYARQDRKTRGREPISAKLMANLLTTAGATRVVTMDLHAGQIQGFFDIPVDNLPGVPTLAEYIMSLNLEDLVVVSPDLGGVSRARQFADRMHAPIAIIEKRRPAPGVAEVMNLIGNVEGKTAVIVDDIVDTAGSLTEGANALTRMGAKTVYACCTHAVLSDPAVERIAKSNITELIVTNTIPMPEAKLHPKIKVLSVAPLLGEAIIRIFGELSVSKLFDN
ncbi:MULTISPECIES: ribose-phosphate pyrophosphokinase [Sporomusa]|jgi:ribose-phosphate pyrophosphokinase|uniref:Ribose-phosphate pyrophosphokinase n=2 Tax=Sporomusa TaxID=2375 RepID=A0ABP2C514_9FIRM|nr:MULTISPECIES: ribose-phosphate pyrophosphokinase [Sporomusa]MCM0761315.1 ribose-phosphate pyrophosphokinase [Sporomusa sphaeroides DSM 2875]OLS56679.1 ribose-phosphate pyrophosphokinase [Sporomusa sphaeroides DSM 2875]CVK18626.1 Ribose-phosphate pyrophosphokinase [Sporomusa sphaeroides DSM 2875]SCM82058.1 phosphoribosylpyrophosphate synthase [uncultured Sporomusa sp.]HML32670.1 ribose-phosphate pyrophosphokinase [Sporomusa sphaeroides]